MTPATWTPPNAPGEPIAGEILAVDGDVAWFRFTHRPGGAVHRETVRLAELVQEVDAEDEPHDLEFEIDDDGRITISPGWRRDDEQTSDRLLMVSIDVSAQDIAAWSDEQVQQAQLYAVAAHLSASDNDDIIVPAKPAFLPDFKPFPGVVVWPASGGDHG